MTNRFSRVAIAGLLVLSLSGCLGKLLGGGKPAQLYRLDAAALPAASANAPAPTATRTILLLPVQFEPAIDTDRLLASNGRETSYIKDARWVSPAPVLFERALRSAFIARAPSVAIVGRGDGIAADRALQVSIDQFEARYDVPGGIPEIDVEGEAALIDLKDRAVLMRFQVKATRPAGANEIAAIVAAFDGATAEAVATTVDRVTK